MTGKWGWDDEKMETDGYDKCAVCGEIVKITIGYNPISKEEYVYEFCENCNKEK